MLFSSDHARVLWGTCLVATVMGQCAFAQPSDDLNMSVSPSPIGAGARAAGMADAFVAIADDATAASWNPAGLVQLERPELSIVGAWNRVVDEFYGAPSDPEFEGLHDIENLELNYLSLVYPVPFVVMDRNITVSLNYQQRYDFSRKFSFRRSQRYLLSRAPSVHSVYQRIDFEQSGGLSTVSPAIAFELTHRLSVGASLNLWRSTPFNENSWTQHLRSTQSEMYFGVPGFRFTNTREDYRNFEGENMTLGLLWDVDDRWKVGLRYDTAFTGDVDYSGRISRHRKFRPLSVQSIREDRQVRFPDSLAFGASYRANDRLTLSLDVTRTDWHDFYMKDSQGIRRSLVDGSNVDARLSATDLEPTYTVRLGAEYIFVPRHPEESLERLWTLRGGLFYDEEPATGEKNSWLKGTGEPDAFYGFTLGVGVQLFQRVNIDMAYQYRAGLGVNKDFVRGVKDFEEDFDQHRILLSTVVYF
ncbi:MAG: outer membrane protein transport protein [Candidatus Hydrogenedentes bacterium]|nr:outer membrane protein transport protein [Candidatus Hydrogenedentota bacterium]